MTPHADPPRCPHCEDGTRWVSRHGGNDPDVWPVPCEECDGAGNVRCDEPGCPEIATRWSAYAEQNCCDWHYATWKAEEEANAV